MNKTFLTHFCKKSNSNLLLLQRKQFSIAFSKNGYKSTNPKFEKSSLSDNIKEVMKTLGISTVCYSASTILSFERKRYNKKKIFWQKNSDFSLDRLSQNFPFMQYDSYREDPMKKIFYGILAANATVFLCWNMGIFTPILYRYFLIFRDSPMVASFFSQYSHMDLPHIFMNMYCLNSFMELMGRIMVPTEFFTVYTLGGLVAATFSKISKNLTYSNNPSLGASGSIAAIVAIACMKNRDTRLTIPFIGPALGLSFPGEQALQGIYLIEIASILLGIGHFDNAAHLGGLVFGTFYASKPGQKIFKKFRRLVIEMWSNFKNY